MTRVRLLLCAAVAAPLMVGCATPTPEPIQGVAVEQVVREIKYEIEDYRQYERAHSGDPALNNACKGKLDFQITNVKVVLNAVTDDTNQGTAGATIPVGGGTLGPTGTLSRENKSTETLTFTLFPKDDAPLSKAEEPRQPTMFTGAPISNSLKQLRTSLLAASDSKPCVSFEPGGDKAQDNSYAIGFTVTQTASAGATFKFLIFSIGASTSAQTHAANTITVTFKGAGQAFRQE